MAPKSSSWLKGRKENNLVWKLRTAGGDSQSSQEQWAKEDKKKKSQGGTRPQICSMTQGYKSQTGNFHGKKVSTKVRIGKTSWRNKQRNCHPLQERTKERRSNLWVRCCDEAELASGNKVSPKKNRHIVLKDTKPRGRQRQERQRLSQKKRGSFSRTATQKAQTWNRIGMVF